MRDHTIEGNNRSLRPYRMNQSYDEAIESPVQKTFNEVMAAIDGLVSLYISETPPRNNEEVICLLKKLMNCNIQKFYTKVSSNRGEEKQNEHLLKLLRSSSALIEVGIHFSTLTGSFIRSFLQAIRSNSSITSLRIKSCYGHKERDKLVNPLLVLLSCKNLTTLILQSISITLAEVQCLSRMLAYNTSITTFDLSHNDIGLEGIGYISNSLKSNTVITSLNISYNNLPGDGALQLSKTLKANSSLQNLYLTSNNLGDKGVQCILDLLKINTSLKAVSLAANGITEKGITTLSSRLRSNTSLTRLELNDNKLSTTGVKTILKSLPSLNPSLTIKLVGNDVLNKDIQQYIVTQTQHYAGGMARIVAKIR